MVIIAPDVCVSGTLLSKQAYAGTLLSLFLSRILSEPLGAWMDDNKLALTIVLSQFIAPCYHFLTCNLAIHICIYGILDQTTHDFRPQSAKEWMLLGRKIYTNPYIDHWCNRKHLKLLTMILFGRWVTEKAHASVPKGSDIWISPYVIICSWATSCSPLHIPGFSSIALATIFKWIPREHANTVRNQNAKKITNERAAR